MIYLVWGPPGAGKTTYVNNHKIDGDLIVDWDAIFRAISGNKSYSKPNNLYEVVDLIRKTLMENLNSFNVANIWVTTTSTSKHFRNDFYKRYNATGIKLVPEMNTCIRHISKDETRKENIEGWIQIIRKWYQRYEKSCA